MTGSVDPVSRAERVVRALRRAALSAATCESLTGGLVGATLTSVPGASTVYRGGLVTYASDLKASLAGVDADWIASHGVINATTAAQMALGCARTCGADVGMSCTGVAGPDPQDGFGAGTVYVAVSVRGEVTVRDLALAGDRQSIRRQTVDALLALVLEVLGVEA